MKLLHACVRRAFWITLVALVAVGCSKTEKGTPNKPVAEAKPEVPDGRTALDRYVAAPDTNYSFTLVQSIPGKGWTTYVLEMTSQAWLTTKEVDRPVWKHWMTIVKPDAVATSKSLLFIGGGANGGEPPKGPTEQLVKIALVT